MSPIPTFLMTALAVATLVVAAPATLAQSAPADASGGSVSVKFVDQSNTVLAPITAAETATFELEIRCTHPTPEPMSITVEVDANHPAVAVSVDRPTVQRSFAPGECDPASAPAIEPVVVTATATEEAAFGEPLNITLSATLADQEPSSAMASFIAGFYDNFQGRFQQQIFKTAPGSFVSVPVRLDNFGNGPVKVSLATAENSSADLLVVTPGTLHVPGIHGEHNRLEFTVDVKAPATTGYINEQHGLIVIVEREAPDGGATELNPLVLTAVIQVQGTQFGAAPGPGPVAFVFAALGMLALSRRLR